MAIKYTYKSLCCGHIYVEQRTESEPMYFTTCNTCGLDDYELISSEVIE